MLKQSKKFVVINLLAEQKLWKSMKVVNRECYSVHHRSFPWLFHNQPQRQCH